MFSHLEHFIWRYLEITDYMTNIVSRPSAFSSLSILNRFGRVYRPLKALSAREDEGWHRLRPSSGAVNESPCLFKWHSCSEGNFPGLFVSAMICTSCGTAKEVIQHSCNKKKLKLHAGCVAAFTDALKIKKGDSYCALATTAQKSHVISFRATWLGTFYAVLQVGNTQKAK